MTEQQFDVFLCHNSEDKSAVIQIAQQLRQNNLKPWLDVWELQPGAIWQYSLEQQIERIGAAAVFVGQQGLGPWQSEEIYAFLQEFIGRKCPVIPVMLAGAPQQPKLPIFLRNRHWVDFRLQAPDPLVQLVWGITGVRPSAPLNTAQVVDIQIAAAPPTTLPVAPPPAPEDDLSSEKGIDYRNLRALLKAGKWEAADEETYNRMVEAIVRKDYYFRPEELRNFPCTDLLTVDALWGRYSNGKWGFSVQKRIYVECGAKLDGKYPGDKIWHEFCCRVGWRKGNSYERDPTFNLKNSPAGELPYLVGGGFGVSGVVGVLTGGWGWVGGGVVVPFLASRLVKCSR